MYILKVFIEHPVQSLDTTFDYLSQQQVNEGVRVKVRFGRQTIIGYVDQVIETHKSKTELETESGFKYQYILEVIDQEALLNAELIELSKTLSKMTLSPRIACLQSMLPTSLKPSSSKKVGIKTIKVVNVIKSGIPETKKQLECLEFLYDHKNIRVKDIPYSKGVLDHLEKQGFILYETIESYRAPTLYYHTEEKNIQLTQTQQNIVDQILERKDKVSLIHGVTGSGKTEVYLSLTSHMLKEDKTVLMLVPEISLTPMMVQSFRQRFGDQVAILHSRLSQGEKYDEYRRIKRQSVKIVVGARSAVFAPLENIGLIILDEEHDASYKQESTPRYLTSQVAKIRAKTHDALVVLGSATPSLESYSRALKGVYKLYEMKERINQKALPAVEIVDMVQEMKNKNYSLFSHAMNHAIEKTLANGEQVILLLNKRGYATFLECKSCGEVIKCPHCDVTLTYHKSSHSLKCHYCDYQEPYPSSCPHCHEDKLKSVGYGTQMVEEQLTEMFAKAKVIRYDVDTTKGKHGHDQLLDQFRRQEGNILLGTQMIAKGLDFENVTFVGVLNADMSLNFPDYRSSERTFQLLCQVAGRSGRGEKKGSVLIQTYSPDHYVMETVQTHNYKLFYEKEMEYRKIAKYPPYCHIVSLLIQSKDVTNLENASSYIAQYLKKNTRNSQVLGPSDSTIFKLQDVYRKRILIKFVASQDIYEALSNVNDYFNKKQKGKVRVVFDFNPYSQI